jgi:hypothetical protein
MHTHPNSAAYPALAAAIEYAALGIAVIQSHWPTAPTGQPHHTSSLVVCSCGDADCPAPAAHPVTSIDDATVNIAQVIGRWSANPHANVATPAGISFDVLECRDNQTLNRLAEQGIEPGPTIDLGDGRLRFPVRASLSAGPRASATRHDTAWCLDAGTPVLLPPSRLVDGREITWLCPFDDRVVLLPERDQLLDALLQLPTTTRLDEPPAEAVTCEQPAGQTTNPRRRREAPHMREQPGSRSCPGSRADVVCGTGSYVGGRASRVTRGHHLRSGMA